ncbi:hypothetical protein PCS_03280 [Desulfocurvibacter africanus PCS]|uniref:Uncharacterized protein n=1 Tax=Desulfocurvibacter africanus PCS TaxID=1262666 RepID=M5PNP7_DESAF|nr:hypothetical protein [Desulfocurvibacter africanus]EMG35797.1 hypothetical protein PCS_03280 [Desulfocurvibacter africanus PCS]
MRSHSFLFEPACWSVQGKYYGMDGSSVPAEGETLVSHQADGWRCDGVTRLLWPEESLEFTMACLVRPFCGNDWTTWEADTPGFGIMHGKYVLAADAILCLGQTLGGAFTLSECLVMLDKNRYLSRGAIVKGSSKMSSWAVEFLRGD